jgi:elongation factor 1-beta
MGDVIVTFKVMPASGDADIAELEKVITEKIKPNRMAKEPIAFGLVALKVTKLIPDAGGEMDKVEADLRAIDGVGEVEVEEMSRSL